MAKAQTTSENPQGEVSQQDRMNWVSALSHKKHERTDING